MDTSEDKSKKEYPSLWGALKPGTLYRQSSKPNISTKPDYLEELLNEKKLTRWSPPPQLRRPIGVPDVTPKPPKHTSENKITEKQEVTPVLIQIRPPRQNCCRFM